MCELPGDKLRQATNKAAFDAMFKPSMDALKRAEERAAKIHQTYLDNLAVDAEQAEEEDPWSTQA